MTMTQDRYQTEHNDFGAPDSLGSGSGAPRAPRKGKPEWQKLLENDRLRALTAAQLEDAVAVMRGGDSESPAERANTEYLAEQLGDVVRALKAG